MTRDRTIHHVAGLLHDLGWTVYDLRLGNGPPLAVVAFGQRPRLVAVAKAAEPKGSRPYPRLERAGAAHVLASVASDGSVEFLDALSGSAVEMSPEPRNCAEGTPNGRTGALPSGEPCLLP